MKRVMVLGALALLGGSAHAEGLLTEKVLPISLAVEAAQAAQASCAQQGFKVTVSFVDRSGATKLLMVGDGAGALTVDLGPRKAYTAAILGDTSGNIAKRAQSMPDGGKGFQALDTRFMFLAGGVPIKAGDEVIGAIGVSGAPGPDKDEACAQAGIDKIKDRLK